MRNHPDIDEITKLNAQMIHEVCAEVLANPKQDLPLAEGPYFKEVPYFADLVAKRSHDLLCIPE